MAAANENKETIVRNSHLDWSSKQSRILTGGGQAEALYTAARGYPFEETELPHHHLTKGNTHAAFDEWRNQQDEAVSATLVGAWKRLLFYGGFEHATTKDERTYNLQTRNLFIDLRVPRTREAVLPSDKTSLQDLTKEELRLYARQHVFSGYTKVVTSGKEYLCTRHHCIDWNFVGVPRSRPNKWYAELKAEAEGTPLRTWKEWAFAKDDRGQHYYCEQWERLPQGEATPILALRKPRNAKRDGVILIIGDHFNYVFARDLSSLSEEKQKKYSSYGSTVGLVDAALDQDDLDVARAYLSIQGGHGTISSGWVVDCANEPWMEGKPFWDAQDPISVEGEKLNDCKVVRKNEEWDVFDTTLTSVAELKEVLGNKKRKREP